MEAALFEGAVSGVIVVEHADEPYDNWNLVSHFVATSDEITRITVQSL
jgi:hypothetical protein